MWKQPTLITSPYNWPAIPKPTPSNWTNWQWALHQTLSLGPQQTLPTPLGRWNANSTTTQMWFFSPLDEAVYTNDTPRNGTGMPKYHNALKPRSFTRTASHILDSPK